MSDEIKLPPEAMRLLGRQHEGLTPFSPCLCGKLLERGKWVRKWYSGHQGKGGINYDELLCEDCRKEFEGMPRIVCRGCRSLMGFIKPGKVATGFEFERRRHYHIKDCPKCNPAVTATPVEEHEFYCAQMGVKVRVNHDLVQEIEQKTLQGAREAEKLRQQFENSKR